MPAARLFDEVLKLFHAGHAVRSFDLLVHYGLLQYLFPAVAELLEGPEGESVAEFVRTGLANTDQRVAEDKPITPMFLYAVLLWPAVRRLADELESEGESEYAAMHGALGRLVTEQIERTSLPKRFGTPMKEMLVMQRRFVQRRGARVSRLLQHKRFRAAFDFMLLRASVGEVEQDVADWWSARQESDEPEEAASSTFKRSRRSRRGGRRRSRSRASDAARQ